MNVLIRLLPIAIASLASAWVAQATLAQAVQQAPRLA